MKMPDYYPVNFVYSYKTLDPSHLKAATSPETQFAYYRILYYFSESEKVNWERLKEIYEHLFNRSNLEKEAIGPFENLNELNQFVLKACHEFHLPYAYLLSVTDYNSGICNVFDVRSFRRIFSNYGKKLMNPTFRPERSSFFKRIFRDG